MRANQLQTLTVQNIREEQDQDNMRDITQVTGHTAWLIMLTRSVKTKIDTCRIINGQNKIERLKFDWVHNLQDESIQANLEKFDSVENNPIKRCGP